MSNAELGVNYPCYGEYKCYRCNKTWASLKSWRNFGQKCKSCDDSVKPDEASLLQLYYYVCKTCEKVWKNKHVDIGQSCKNCNSLVKPIAHNVYIKSRIGKPSLFKNSDAYDSKGGHREDLCEKCQTYGPPCSVTYASATNRNSSGVASSTSISERSSRQVPKNNLLQPNLVTPKYGSKTKANNVPVSSTTYAPVTKRNSSHVVPSSVSAFALPPERNTSSQVVRNHPPQSNFVTQNYGCSTKANDKPAWSNTYDTANNSSRVATSSADFASERNLRRQPEQNISSQHKFITQDKKLCIIS